MIPISNESVVKIKLGAFLKEVGKPVIQLVKILFGILAWILELLYGIWKRIFLVVYKNRNYLLAVTYKLVGILDLVLLGIFLIRLYGFQKKEIIYIHILYGYSLGTIGITLAFYLYYKLVGRNNLLERNVLLTEKYVEEVLPPIIKIYGPPRIGKDTTGISFTSILARRNRRVIPIAMKRIRKICYIFDFLLVNQVCNIHYRDFLSSSRDTRRDNFIKLCKRSENKAFIKERYLEKINYQELVAEYEYYLKHKVGFESEYLYDDGISKKHLLELLNEYMFLYVRLYIMKNFTLMNQPYIENPETNLTGKVYSMNYEAVATPKPKAFEFIDKDGRKVKVTAEEKVEFPITDWTIINLSENDTWVNNLDTIVGKKIKDQHQREFHAYYGHGYEMLTMIQICHDAERTQKVFRELDAFYINILQRVEYLGAQKRVLVLAFFQRITNYFAEKGNLKLDDANNSISYTRYEKIEYYKRLYRASGDDKYLALIEDIKAKEMKQKNKFYEAMTRWNQKLMSKIERLQRKYGVIKITATISDKPGAPNLKEATLEQLINRETPLYHEAYRVDFYFRMTDSMGRYNHKYMSDVLDNRAKQSTKTFHDIECWDESMMLNKNAMLNMAYPAGFEMYGITDEEVYERWYKPVGK